MRLGVALADRDLVDADHPGSGLAGARQLRPHVLLVELLDRVPIKLELPGDILDRRDAAAPADEGGKPLRVERIVGQELQPLPPHLAARSAKDAPDLDLKIHARVAARQIAHAPHRAIVPAPMERAAVGAARFFERRFSLTMRALGSPKMPRTVVSGPKPGNAYASHSRRFRLPAAAIEIPSSSERPTPARNPVTMRLTDALSPTIHPHDTTKTQYSSALQIVIQGFRIGRP